MLKKEEEVKLDKHKSSARDEGVAGVTVLASRSWLEGLQRCRSAPKFFFGKML